VTRGDLSRDDKLASKPLGRLAAPICGLALAWLVAPATALAETHGPAPEPPAPQAHEALEAAVEALEADPGAEPERGASPALAALAEALPALSGSDRRRARALLARPTDQASDPFGDGYTVPRGQIRHTQSAQGNFCITWVRSGPDAPDLTDSNGDGIPDYVAAIAAIAELSYAVQIGELGWRPPKPDLREECGEPQQTDIYLMELGELGLFGYAASDPGQGGARRVHGYLVIDNDYSRSRFGRFDEPLDAARVTIAHEFNHLIQYAYNSRQDPWMLESTATWMEEQVHPDINDYLNYVPHFARTPGVPITDHGAAGGLKVYGSAVWNHWLEHGDRRYGPGVVRRTWEVSRITRPRDFAISAYARAILGAGGRGVAREFVDFAAATAEWRAGVGGFPDAAAYPDVRREGRLARRREFRLDHTAYRLLRVPRVAAPRIRLAVRAQRGLRSGVALVARRGGPVDGDVVRRVKFLPKGGRTSVAIRNPRRFKRITAVLVNADARARGFSFRSGDWRYRKDSRRFSARLIRR
jgi:hypothetical protein